MPVVPTVRARRSRATLPCAVVLALLLAAAGSAAALMPRLPSPDFAATWEVLSAPDGPRTDDPDAWATAARAAIAHAFYGLAPGEPAGPWIDRAQSAADRALSLDPDHVPALLLRAQALGERAQGAGFPDPFLPNALRSMLERAHALAPDAADTQVALGLLHLELTRRGIGWAYGGRAEQGQSLVHRGLAVASDDRIDLRLMVGRMHLDRGERERGLEILRDAVRAAEAIAASDDELDAFQREALREVAELLDAHDAP